MKYEIIMKKKIMYDVNEELYKKIDIMKNEEKWMKLMKKNMILSIMNIWSMW